MSINYEDKSFKDLDLQMDKSIIQEICGEEFKVCEIIPKKYLIFEDRQFQIDHVVRLDDGSLLIIEFQSTVPTDDDLSRFLDHVVALGIKFDCSVLSLIVCTADIENTQYLFKLSSIVEFRPLCKNFKHIDGEKTLKDITNKFNNNEVLTDRDKINLALISLYSFDKNVYFDKIKEAAELLIKLKLNKEDEDIIATTQLLLANKFLNKKQIKKINRLLFMRVSPIEEYANELAEEKKEEGIKIGEYNKAIEIAKNLCNSNIAIGDIAKMTGLPIEEVNKLI